MFKKLLQHGADPKIKDNEGTDVEQLCKENGYKNLWEMINAEGQLATSMSVSQFNEAQAKSENDNETRQSTLSG